MKFFPSSLATLPVLLLSSFLTLGPTPIQAANGPSHFVISTPSTNSPWQADGVNPLAWTYSKSESVSQAVDQGKGGNENTDRGRARRVSLTVVTSDGLRRRAALDMKRSGHAGRKFMDATGRWNASKESNVWRRRDSRAEERRGCYSCAARRREQNADLSLCFLPLAADILQFDVELLRLSGTGLLLVAKNGAFFLELVILPSGH